jgi:hypothetical protein
MARMTDAEKAERKRQRMIEKAYEKQIPTYISKFVAKVFQRMIRAEAAALPAGSMTAIIKGELRAVRRGVGQCVCVTCGKVAPWTTHEGTMQTGHFLHGGGSRFTADNVFPQCVWCNEHRSGAADDYRLWMEEVRGKETIERLTRLWATPASFTREELVDMRIGYEARLKAAIERMKTS